MDIERRTISSQTSYAYFNFEPIHKESESVKEEHVIHSPLDQRSYKPITLPNGVRVMLISTKDIEYFAPEQDATKPPCQVPEVAEFNKKYLGYDNPVARVRCACPCDGRKSCCGPHGNACCKHERRNTNEMDGPGHSQHHPAGHVTYAQAPGFANHASVNEGHINENAVGKMRELNRDRSGESTPTKSEENGKFDIQARQLKIALDSLCKDCQNPKFANDSVSDGGSTLTTAVQTEDLDTRHMSHGSRLASRYYPFPPQSYNPETCCVDVTGTGTARASRPRKRTARPHLNYEDDLDFEGSVYLVIGAGYFNDPDDQPGLAHFCEHGVFLGSKKFPEPNQLFKLVLPYDGYVNAFTSGMSTTFAVSASSKLLPSAVEILADMVGFPLFPNALVSAELEALDSEYSLRQDDTPKYFQLIGSLAKKGHVMRKMDSGNISTLTVPNFYRKLVEWRRIYYSPQKMTLAIEAPFPLDYLENLVAETFGKIPLGHISMPNKSLTNICPFDLTRFHQIYHVPSVHHSEFIALHWPLDAKAWKNLKVKPLEYLGAIIVQKAEGGLAHHLTSQGLATNVDAGCWESDVTRNHYTSVFSISVDITEKGFNQQDSVLRAIFGYITMLIKNGPQKTFFQEFQKQQLDSFHYKGSESSLSIADSVSKWMQFIPAKWCLVSPTLTCEFDSALIQRLTECLTVESANVIVFSKNYRGVENVGGSGMEEFYNTPFAAFNFSPELEKMLTDSSEEYSLKFSLPPPNPLLLDTMCKRSAPQDLLDKGTILKVKGKVSISYADRNVRLVRGLLPQARISAWIDSPSSSFVGAPEGSSTKILIWAHYLNELFQTKFYHASNADLQLEAEVSQGELHLTLAGSHLLLPCLFEQVIDLINDFENVADPTGFDVVRSAFIEELDNTILDNRFLAWDLYYYLWTNNHQLIFDHRRHADKLTFASFISFVKSFKIKMYIQVHLYGYITKQQGDIVVSALQKLQYEPIELRQYLLLRCLKVPLGERIVKVNSQNPNIHTSVVINSYQFGMLSEQEEDAMNFFAKTMSDAAFYQLRTEQQLGYIVIIYSEITFGVSSIVVELVTQPKNFTTEYCNECIDDFLLNFFVENMSSPEHYAKFSIGKPKPDLPFNVLAELFQTYLLPNPFHYRKLSIQVVGTSGDADELEEDDPSAEKNSAPKRRSTGDSNNNAAVFTSTAGSKSQSVDGDAASWNPNFAYRGSKAHRTESMDASKTIEVAKSAKKSLQLKSGYNNNYSMGYKNAYKKGEVYPKVVRDLEKFKKSLAHWRKAKV